LVAGSRKNFECPRLRLVAGGGLSPAAAKLVYINILIFRLGAGSVFFAGCHRAFFFYFEFSIFGLGQAALLHRLPPSLFYFEFSIFELGAGGVASPSSAKPFGTSNSPSLGWGQETLLRRLPPSLLYFEFLAFFVLSSACG
jgi:hypothetical protein